MPLEQSPDRLRLIACPHLLSIEKGRVDTLRPIGGTVTDLLRSIGWTRDGQSARVFLDGVLVRDAAWEYTMPRAGQVLVVRAVPMDSGGGGGKDVGRLVAMIGILALAFAAPMLIGAMGVLGSLIVTTPFVAGALTAAVSIVGTLAINALIPPASPKLNALSGLTNNSNTLSLTGTSNQLIPYGVVPRVYGRHRIFPPLGARHFTEVAGDQQYLRALFCLGPGPLALSDFKIGENTIDLFKDVELEVHQGYPTDPPHELCPNSVSEEPLSIPIKTTVGSVIRTSQPNATELSIDVTFLGLWTDHLDGPQPHTVSIRVEYRKQGDTTFLLANGQPATIASRATALSGTNNDLMFTAVRKGAAANNITIAYVDISNPHNLNPPAETLTVTPNGSGWAFVVGLRKTGGLYSRASQVKAFLDHASFTVRNVGTARDENTAASITRTVASILSIALAAGNDGTGRVAPMAAVRLAGGRNETAALVVTERKTTQFRVPLTWHTPEPGTYEVQLSRLTADSTDPGIHDDFYWTSLRTVRSGIQLIPPGMASVAVRIKATDQLHGTLDSFNCFAESILPDWDGFSWVPRITSNPASIFRDLHQGTANARPKPDSRMDLPTLEAFHTRCTQHGFAFNAIIDFRSTVSELGRDVLAAGRAAPGSRDGKVSCIEDVPQTIPAQVLTPRNSWGFKGTKIFADLPHALKVRFVNADTLQQDERVVLADGYGVTDADGIRRDAFGAPTSLPEATKFEAVEAGLGVNDPEQIFKLQRYHLAVLALRPESYTLNCDFEQLVMRPGDLVYVQHDVPLFGLCSGRITAVGADDLGRASTITLDEPCLMQAGDRYGVRLRLKDGTQIQREVLNVPGEQTTLTLLEPV